MTTASPKSNIRADTSGVGATPPIFSFSRPAIRPGLSSCWSLLELTAANSSATWALQSAALWATAALSSARYDATTSFSPGVLGRYGTLLQGFSQTLPAPGVTLGGASSDLTSW